LAVRSAILATAWLLVCTLHCLLFELYLVRVFPVLFCLSVSVKLAVNTTFEMTEIVSGGALNSTPTQLGWVAVGGISSQCVASSGVNYHWTLYKRLKI